LGESNKTSPSVD